MSRSYISIILIVGLVLGPVSISRSEPLLLPPPGTAVSLTAAHVPLLVRGIRIHPENPFNFDFIVDTGNTGLKEQRLEEESRRLIQYFLASLTIPEKDLWVNLSPYESQRVIPEEFGKTQMGRDFLAIDYLLKQLNASLTDPRQQLGKVFWSRVYQQAASRYQTTNIPVDTFNKVWIVPDNAVVETSGTMAMVAGSHLKVMLDVDYLAMNKDLASQKNNTERAGIVNEVSTGLIREIILPAIEKEVNEGEAFATLRQIFHSLILAVWFKRNLKENLLSQSYADQKKITGVKLDDGAQGQQIYVQYLRAFKKGVYNYIKEEDNGAGKVVPRRYFSGGLLFGPSQFDAILSTRNLSSGNFKANLQNRRVGQLHLVSQESRPVFSKVSPAMVSNNRPGLIKMRPFEASEIEILRNVGTLSSHIKSNTKGREFEVMSLTATVKDEDSSYMERLQAGLILAALPDDHEAMLLGVRQILEHIRTQHYIALTPDRPPQRILEKALEEITLIPLNKIQDIDLSNAVREELGWWLENAWGTPEAAVILRGMNNSPSANYYETRLKINGRFLKIGDLLADKGVDAKVVRATLKADPHGGISKQNYLHWKFEEGGRNVIIPSSDWDAVKRYAEKLIKERSVYGSVILPEQINEVMRRIDALKHIPDIVRARLAATLGAQKVVSMYVTGSYLWGHKKEAPTDLDILVLTDGEGHEDIQLPLLPSDIPDGERLPPYMEIGITGKKTFLEGTGHRKEAYKMILYQSGLLIDGEDVYSNQTPPIQNKLVFINDLYINGKKEYLDRTLNNDDPADRLYYVRKASRRIVEAEITVRSIDPTINVDVAYITRLFMNYNNPLLPPEKRVTLSDIEKAYTGLGDEKSGHIVEVRDSILREFQIQQLVQLMNTISVSKPVPSRDAAVMAVDNKTGGLDFTEQLLKIETMSRNAAVRFTRNAFRTAPFDGLEPVILGITPINSLFFEDQSRR
jgi:hypothetical protein